MLGKLRKLQRLIFMGYIITMPFICVSTKLSIPLLSNSWPNYLFLLSIGTLIYEYFKFGLEIPKKVKWYLIIFFVWYVLCLVLGLVFYEYNEMLTVATNVSKWLRKLVCVCPCLLKVFSELTLVKIWQFAKGVQSLVLQIMQIPLMMCYIYHIYQNNLDLAISDATKASWILCGAMAFHSFFELSYYWFGAEWGKSYLLALNPWIYKLPPEGYWWPPLLQYGDWQLRSLCVEPSCVAWVVAVAIPFLWLAYTKYKSNLAKISFLVFWTFLSVLLFATKSRSVNIILLVELIALFASTLAIKKRCFTRSIVSICLVTFAVLFCVTSTGTIKCSPDRPITEISESIQLKGIWGYLYDNLFNAAERDARSNNTRRADIYASLAVLKKHPVFGVGTGLADCYRLDNLPNWARNNMEIKNWSLNPTEDGKITCIFPTNNLYFKQTENAGIVGLFIFILPLFYCMYLCILNIKNLLRDECAICLYCTFLSSLLLGFAGAEHSKIPIPVALLLLWCNQFEIKGDQ